MAKIGQFIYPWGNGHYSRMMRLNDKLKETTHTVDKNDHGSIESVPFISQPAKKKSVKTKKDSA